MKSFILEIGVEEIPPFEIRPIEGQLRENLIRILEEERFQFDGIRSFATPRRVAIFIEKLSRRGRDVEREEIGPPKEIAIREGRWTKAAEGFARRLGISVEELYEVRRGDKVYVAGKVILRGRDIEEVLAYPLEKA